MAQTHSGIKRIRKYYGNIREVLDIPNLIQVQKSSYDLFLNSGDQSQPLDGEGINACFPIGFPDQRFQRNSSSGVR